jgi:hypothetical protein
LEGNPKALRKFAPFPERNTSRVRFKAREMLTAGFGRCGKHWCHARIGGQIHLAVRDRDGEGAKG